MFLPVGLLYALIPIIGAALIGVASWIFSKLTRHAELIAAAAEQLADHDRRLNRLEIWQDGYRAGVKRRGV